MSQHVGVTMSGCVTDFVIWCVGAYEHAVVCVHMSVCYGIYMYLYVYKHICYGVCRIVC